MNKKDLRVQKTLSSIHNALCEIILKYEYDAITVKLLCDIAMINKKTFYNYYSSLDDLFIKLQNKIAAEIWEQFSKYKIPDELDKINEEFFRFRKSACRFQGRKENSR